MNKRSDRSRKVRYALVGLGNIAQVAVLPGFLNATSNSELVAFVSDDPKKLSQLAQRYKVEHCVHYDRFEQGLKTAAVDAVYIALPNHLHCEFSIRAADSGVHVLCEKPLSIEEADCIEMARACTDNRVWLMTAYRLHFEKANLEAAKVIHSGAIGDPRYFTSTFSMQVKEGIRTRAKAGGGTLYDIGIYCINAARYLFRAEPEEVFAFSTYGGDRRFREVDEMTTASLRFPQGRLATFTASFGAADTAFYEVVGTKGSVRLHQAYEFGEAMTLEVSIGSKTQKKQFPKRDQFGPEIIYFSDCILRNREPEPSALEGLIDVHIIRSLYDSADRGRPIALERFQRIRRPEPRQEIYRKPRRPLHLVHTEPPNR